MGVRSLGQEHSLKKGMATYSSILGWRIPWTKEPGGLYSPWDHKESETTEWLTLTFSDMTVLPWWSVVKNPPASVGDVGLTAGSGRSPGEGNGNPLQYFAWEIPWTDEAGGLQSMGSRRVSHDLGTKEQQLISVTKYPFRLPPLSPMTF